MDTTKLMTAGESSLVPVPSRAWHRTLEAFASTFVSSATLATPSRAQGPSPRGLLTRVRIDASAMHAVASRRCPMTARRPAP